MYERIKNGSRKMRIVPTLDLSPYAPNVAGRFPDRNALTLATANRLGSVMRDTLASFLGENHQISVADFISRFGLSGGGSNETLGQMLAEYGSDKSTGHNYHLVYGSLFSDPSLVKQVIEIGIGTNSPDVLSTMGASHEGVGGSLRAWQEFFPNSSVIGFDIDSRALFREDRIRTFQLDQISESSLQTNFSVLEQNSVDLFIDDGLHSLDANLMPIRFVFSKIRPGGWLIVEDIHREAVPFWEAFSVAFPKSEGEAAVVETDNASMFVLRKSKT